MERALVETVDGGRFPPAVGDYLEGGAGDQSTLRRNQESFARWEFMPRVMSGAAPPSTATQFMGLPLELPVLTAPFGSDALFHPEGQIAVARANAASWTLGIAPEAGSFSLEEIAAEAAPTAIGLAQLHPMGSPGNSARMLSRIENAGYRGVCVTLDCPTAGWRERLLCEEIRTVLSPLGRGGVRPRPPSGTRDSLVNWPPLTERGRSSLGHLGLSRCVAGPQS